ncbi:hypothetical protein SUGI_0194170 [Cryptomeria japonica]|nr:hypothetical protein SUGI_0194170 [Cryptomeria japonica]
MGQAICSFEAKVALHPTMAIPLALALVCVIFMTPGAAWGALVQHTFTVKTVNVTRLCKQQQIVTVNGQFPGPPIYVNNGDNLVVHVINQAAYNITIHWHGIRQMRSGWADGPAYITQCPITPGSSYTYNFTIKDQEGTLWWHAHILWLRATVYGALIIKPPSTITYPFVRPDAEYPIILGEWWNANIVDVLNQGIQTGQLQDSDAYTINSQPGDLYPCSAPDTSYRILVQTGKKYLLRIISAVMNEPLFFTIANHKMIVVSVDASYTKPYFTDVVVIYPGQTVDVLFVAGCSSGSYYMATRAYRSGPFVPINNSTATAILQYTNNTVPVMPSLPQFNDTPTAFKFSTGLRSAFPSIPIVFPYLSTLNSYFPGLFPSVPTTIDEKMLITEGIGLKVCPPNTCTASGGLRVVGSFNNISFVRPQIAILQAYYLGIAGVYTTDFPSNPPLVFNYTATNQRQDILFPESGTKVKVLPFNSNVEIVFQGTSILSNESHPVHIHGFDFYVVGQGFGNYDPQKDPQKFNLVDPPRRNTIGVPPGGWAAIRFKADNPGVWLVHCHFEAHSEFGFDMVFLVENGTRADQKLLPPPLDLPKC